MPTKKTAAKSAKTAAKKPVKKVVKKAAAKPAAKKPAKKRVAKPKAGDAYECVVCGYRLIVDEACGCVEEHIYLCCGKKMTTKRKRKAK